jgi:hypothetical protein
VTKNYVADNAGSGFASFDDDGPSDLESLLADAAKGEEEDDQDTASFFTNTDQDDYSSQSSGLDNSYSSSKNNSSYEEPVKETRPEPSHAIQIDDDEEYDDLPDHEPEPTFSAPVRQRSWERDPNPTFSSESFEPESVTQPSYSAPVYAEPAYSAPAPTPAPAAVPAYSAPSHAAPRTETRPTDTRKRINIPSEAEEILLAGKVIRILDAYRKLSSEVKTVASQFITNGAEVIEDEATLVIKVINVDPMLSTTMRSLREAKALDPVERVFYVIELDDEVLHSLGGLVSVFNGTTIDDSLSKVNYARTLVREIDNLDSRAVNYVESTESILAAADEENN